MESVSICLIEKQQKKLESELERENEKLTRNMGSRIIGINK